MSVGFEIPLLYVQLLALVIAVVGFVSTFYAAFRNSQPVDLAGLFTWLALGIGAAVSFFFVSGSTLVIHYYGIIIMAGALAGGWLASYRVKRQGLDPVIVGDLLVWLVLGGVIGARLWHVLTPSPSSLVPDPLTGEMVNPYFAGGRIQILDILSLWKGGLGIPGAVIGGLVALFFFCRKYKQSFSWWVDLASPSLALGQAIGRWGNFLNQELYGMPTNVPWKMYIEPGRRLPGFMDVAYYHPLFLYESLWNLANMFFLLWLSRRFAGRLKPGDIFLAYLVIYPVGRFLMDFLRLDASQVGGINFNQTFMAVVAVCAAALFAWRHRPALAADESA